MISMHVLCTRVYIIHYMYHTQCILHIYVITHACMHTYIIVKYSICPKCKVSICKLTIVIYHIKRKKEKSNTIIST